MRSPPPLLTLVVVAVLGGCLRSEAEDAGVTLAATDDDRQAWVSHSADGRTTLWQRPAPAGQGCVLSCEGPRGVKLWQATAPCLAEKHERRYLDPTCETVAVISPAPDRALEWAAAPVIRLHRRQAPGVVVFGASVLEETAWRKSVSWVQGCYGAPGEPPRYSADGLAVELTTIAGVTLSVPLRGDAVVTLPALGPHR